MEGNKVHLFTVCLLFYYLASSARTECKQQNSFDITSNNHHESKSFNSVSTKRIRTVPSSLFREANGLDRSGDFSRKLRRYRREIALVDASLDIHNTEHIPERKTVPWFIEGGSGDGEFQLENTSTLSGVHDNLLNLRKIHPEPNELLKPTNKKLQAPLQLARKSQRLMSDDEEIQQENTLGNSKIPQETTSGNFKIHQEDTSEVHQEDISEVYQEDISEVYQEDTSESPKVVHEDTSETTKLHQEDTSSQTSKNHHKEHTSTSRPEYHSSTSATTLQNLLPTSCFEIPCNPNDILLQTPSNVVLAESSTLALSCRRKMNANLLFWSFSNGSRAILLTNTTSDELSLVLNDSKSKDSGVYKCIAQGGKNPPCCYQESHVIIYVTPNYRTHLLIIGCVAGASVLTCGVLVALRKRKVIRRYSRQYARCERKPREREYFT